MKQMLCAEMATKINYNDPAIMKNSGIFIAHEGIK
jgi:hypothetical protein